MTDSVFYHHYLKSEFARRCERNRAYSLRAYARALGLAPGALSEVFSGKRVPSYRMARKLVAALDLSPTEEERFLSSLAEKHQSRGLERVNPIFRKYPSKDKPTDRAKAVPELSVELFRV